MKSSLLIFNYFKGVADFYVSPKRSSDPTRQLTWLTRWFWSIWFDLDNIYLHHSRRDYLEHKFKTIKTLNGRNRFLGGTGLVKIPYYVWIGGQKAAELGGIGVAAMGDGVFADAAVAATEPTAERIEDFNDEDDEDVAVEKFVAPDLSAIEKPHVSSDHVHGQGLKWRQPFDAALIPRFSTYS